MNRKDYLAICIMLRLVPWLILAVLLLGIAHLIGD